MPLGASQLKVDHYRENSSGMIVPAMQLLWKTWDDFCSFTGDMINQFNPGRNSTQTNEQNGETAPFIEATIPSDVSSTKTPIIVKHGDYIIKNANGSFTSFDPTFFRTWFTKVESP